eukprot:TRINITY_DN13339_c0_g1_i3.p1 TRINITY_DN13339_c0_g1~~TRINITY_DN13339_c0_g1_i3.p1  ORF type:complete len:212 (+),score=56.10 TRINITY_DN13339_c0_g1_i3:83-718(+)
MPKGLAAAALGALKSLAPSADVAAAEEAAKVPCQRWVVTEGLHDAFHGIGSMQQTSTPWLGGRSEPPLGRVSAKVAEHLAAARAQLRDVHLQLLRRHVDPMHMALKPEEWRMLRKDPKSFFSYVNDDAVREMRSGVHRLQDALIQNETDQHNFMEATLTQDRSRWEKAAGVKFVDAAEATRQHLALQELVLTSKRALKAAQRCNQVRAAAI